MSSTKSSKLFSSIAGFVLLVIVGAFSLLMLWPNSNAEPKCASFADPIRVKISGIEFYIPAAYSPTLVTNTGEEPIITYDAKRGSGYCQKETDRAYEVDKISISNNASNLEEKLKQNGNKFKFFPQYSFQIQSSTSPIKDYCSIYSKLVTGVSNWEKDKNNPFLLRAADENFTYYKSSKLKFFGLPVVIACEPATANLDGLCRVDHPFHPLGEKLIITYFQFQDTNIGPEHWSDALLEAEALIRDMAQDSLNNFEEDSCKRFKG